MDDLGLPLDNGGIDLARRMLSWLDHNWPEPFSFDPDRLHLPPGEDDDRRFVSTAQILGDSGCIMMEALLVGIYPRPLIVEATITPRGRDILATLDRSVPDIAMIAPGTPQRGT